MESTAKSMFGSGLNFDDYYLKFIDFEVSLPFPNSVVLANHIRNRLPHYLLHEDRLTAADLDGGNLERDIIALFEGLKLKPRQIEKTLRLVGYLLSTKNEDNKIRYGSCMGLVLLISLRINKPTYYHLLGRGEATVEDMVRIFKDFHLSADHQNRDHLKLSCFALSGISLMNEKNEILDLGFLDMSETDAVHRVAEIAKIWRQHENAGYNFFPELYDRIERARKFIVN